MSVARQQRPPRVLRELRMASLSDVLVSAAGFDYNTDSDDVDDNV